MNIANDNEGRANERGANPNNSGVRTLGGDQPGSCGCCGGKSPSEPECGFSRRHLLQGLEPIRITPRNGT